MNFSHIWNLIVESNTLNFIVLAVILLLVMWKIDVSKMISNLQKNIEKEIDKATSAKTDSEAELKKAEEKMQKIEQEIEVIKESTEKTADILFDKIVNQSQEQIKIIENNTQKVLENDLQKAQKTLSKITAKTSINILKTNIKNKLNEDKNLHQMFINDAITELEGLNI